MRPPFAGYEPAGVIPAVLLPFHADLSIDEGSFRKHLRDVADVDGLSSLTVNGHSTEVSSCSFDEQRRVLQIATDEVGDRIPLVAGVMSESTVEACRIARMSAEEGASCLLVFPPQVFSYGAMNRPEMIKEYYRRIADVTDLPLILFQFPKEWRLATPLGTLVEMAEEIPSLRAIKDYSTNPVEADLQVRTLQNLSRPVNVLTTNAAWMMTSLASGANGILSGSGSTIAPLLVALFQAVKRGDLLEARRVSDQMQPIISAFYADPFLDMHNRMKAAQVLLGNLPNAWVRPPLLQLDQVEIDRLDLALRQAGMETLRATV